MAALVDVATAASSPAVPTHAQELHAGFLACKAKALEEDLHQTAKLYARVILRCYEEMAKGSATYNGCSDDPTSKETLCAVEKRLQADGLQVTLTRYTSSHFIPFCFVVHFSTTPPAAAATAQTQK